MNNRRKLSLTEITSGVSASLLGGLLCVSAVAQNVTENPTPERTAENEASDHSPRNEARTRVAGISRTDPAPDTREEVEQVFAALDRNGDERIDERESKREPALSKRFAGVDSSGDGYLSRAEFRARPSSEPFE